LTSGATVTLAHHALLINKERRRFFFLTILLGIIFTSVQILEYINSRFSLGENSFGSRFFITTGFHGLHVLIGSIFIFYCFYLVLIKKINKWQNLRVEFSI
jgi:cytochrome c oxidase subunit 3